MERRYDFRCRRKPKCWEKTCAGKYGSRTKFTYDSDPTGNQTRVVLVKGTGTTAAPTRPHIQIPLTGYVHLYILNAVLLRLLQPQGYGKGTLQILYCVVTPVEVPAVYPNSYSNLKYPQWYYILRDLYITSKRNLDVYICPYCMLKLKLMMSNNLTIFSDI